MQIKIAVASDNGISLTGHIGRCEMFLIFDIIGKEIVKKAEKINSFTMHKTGNHSNREHHVHHHENEGIGRHIGIINGLKDCKYLICSGAGPGLINDLNANGIEIILTEVMEAEKAVRMFINGELSSDPDRSCKEHN